MASKTPDFLSFVRFGEKDLLPETPHLQVEIQATIELSLTLPYPIRFTIRRLARGDPTDNRPCVFRWNPAIDAFSDYGLVLLRHEPWRNKTEPLPVDHGGSPNEDNLVVDGDSSQFLWELIPGGEVSLMATLPEPYYHAIKRGGLCFVYSLLFSGTDLSLWAWGTIQEHNGQEIKAGRLVVSGGARINFAAVRYTEPSWPERAAYEAEHGFDRTNVAEKEWQDSERERQRRINTLSYRPQSEPSGRVSGAPHFTVAVEGPTSVKSYERATVTLRFTYHGITDADGHIQTSTARPVTFHSWALTGSNEFRIQLKRRRGGPEVNWEDCYLYYENGCTWAIYDGPDVEVHAAQHKDFVTLHPGESWTAMEWLNEMPAGDIALPRDSMPGDEFRYRVWGTEVDWWEWGSKEEHEGTVVKLPCYIKA